MESDPQLLLQQLQFSNKRLEEVREEYFSLHCQLSQQKDQIQVRDEIIAKLQKDVIQYQQQVQELIVKSNCATLIKCPNCQQNKEIDLDLSRTRSISKQLQTQYNLSMTKAKSIQQQLKQQQEEEAKTEKITPQKRNSSDFKRGTQIFEKQTSLFSQEFLKQLLGDNYTNMTKDAMANDSLQKQISAIVNTEDTFFSINNVIFFKPDSPEMRLKVQQSEKQLETMRSMVKHWYHKIKPQMKNSNSKESGYTSIMQCLSDELLHDMALFEGNREIASLFFMFSAFVKQLTEFSQILQNGFENLFFLPMRQLYKVDLQRYKEHQKGYYAAMEEYGKQQFKYYASLGKGGNNKSDIQSQIIQSQQSQTLYIKAYSDYEICKQTYIRSMNQCQMTFNIEIVDKLCALLYSHLAYSSKSLELISNVQEIIDVHSDNLTKKNIFVTEMNKKMQFDEQNTIQDCIQKFKQEILSSSSDTPVQLNLEQVKSKSGYLLHKGKHIKMQYISVQHGMLQSISMIQNQSQLHYKELAKLQLSNLREKTNDSKFSFEVTNNLKATPLVFIASGRLDYQEWVAAIRNQIEHNLSISSTSQQEMNLDEAGKSKLTVRIDNIIQKNLCADCSANAPCWFSANLFVLLCLPCSGIHRKLGPAVSRVRSLKLDKNWPETIAFFSEYGTAAINIIWEANPMAKQITPKPNSEASVQQREAWIRQKYIDRAFLNYTSSNVLFTSLLKTIDTADILRMIKLLMSSHFDVNETQLIDGGTTKQNLFHYCCRNGTSVQLDVLFQFQARLDVVDSENYKPLDIAMIANKEENVNYLVRKLEENMNNQL